MKKQRIDILLVNSGLVESRNKAQRLVMAGEVEVEGQLIHKPSELFEPICRITLRSKPKFVSRGGLKLEKAINEFHIVDIEGKICVDVGASTGGFTDCLLQHGAKKVYSIDVGFGQLHQSLRNDPRVVEMERVNVKEVEKFPDLIDLVTIDVSFISLKRILPIIKIWTNKKILRVIALIKPQFEVGRKIAAKGKGVVRDRNEREKVVNEIVNFARLEGYDVLSVTESPITGPKGKIQELEETLKRAKIIDEKGNSSDKVQIGSNMVIKEEGYPEENIQIVGSKEADPKNGKISYESPIGSALLNHKINDIVRIETPTGKINFKIIDIK